MTQHISKETINRLVKDVKQIIKNPLTENGIYYVHDDTEMLQGYAMIVGPEDTPYFGGYFFFDISYPTDYPHSPPKIKYCTNGDNIRFNPNLYKCGKVCVSLLNTWRGDQWTSCQTISTVLLTLCTLLCKNPLLNEPGVTSVHVDIPKYNNIIEHANIKIAVCDIIKRKPGVFLDFFEIFYPYIKSNFINNQKKILEFVGKKENEFPEKQVITTNMYSLNHYIDYKSLHDTLVECIDLLVDK
jgi:ubiquitin-conjugating enzyme E2 Z